MECEKCGSIDIENTLIKTNYRYFDYFDEYIPESKINFKCKKCGYEWEDCF